MGTAPRALAAPAPRVPFTPVPARRLQRCGGRSCLPGTCGHDDRVGLQRRSIGGPGRRRAPGIVAEVLREHGRPLDGGARALMEPYFGHDFSRVRVHTGQRAATSARAVDAHAYTVGSNVVFGDGRYDPSSPSGRRLLAHELGHVIQQRGAPAGAELSRRTAGASEAALEQEVEAAAAGLEGGRRPDGHGPRPGAAAEAGALQRQADDEGAGGTWVGGEGRFGGGGASGSWAAPNVDLVHVECRSPTSGWIDFHRPAGVMRYRLTSCLATEGEYTATVTVTGIDLNLELDAPGDVLFTFSYQVTPGQPNPSTFFGDQTRVRVVVGPTGPRPAPGPRAGGALVCSRPLDFPWWTGLRNFRHAFVNDPPANYALRTLRWGNGVTTSCVESTDASRPPDVPATSTCKPCLPPPGQTAADVSRCLRATHAAYPNPSLYRNLPDPSDGWRHGPNSNTYAATMARCCDRFSPAGLGTLPGWNHAPAPPCPPRAGPAAAPPEPEPPGRQTPDPGLELPGGAEEPGPPAPSTGSETAPTDLHAFGNLSKPRDPRLGTDLQPNPDGSVGPEPKTPPWPDGASTFGDPDKAPLTGHYHRIASGTKMAEGLRVIADGIEVGGPRDETHHTIFPARQMAFADFVAKFQSLGWVWAGNRRP